MMRIKHVMTKDPTCCVPSDTAQRAAKIMRDEDTGVIPIIENEQSRKVIGIVTDRDLCMNIVAEGRDLRTTRVHESMTTTVVSCSPQDSVNKAPELMRENQIRRLPVVDEQHRLFGHRGDGGYRRPRGPADDRDARDAEDRFRADARAQQATRKIPQG